MNPKLTIKSRCDREQAYFNGLAAADKIYHGKGSEDYLAHPCIPENKKLLSYFPKGFRGLNVLDIGCGVGEAALCFAERGARVAGVDVSDVSLRRARELAEASGLHIQFEAVTDYNLPFSDSSFDLVYGNGVLHHLDLTQSLSEIRRVLKPTGVAFFIEPTTGNPLISVYRRLAKNQRSPDEKPLGEHEYQLIENMFPKPEIIPYQVTTLLAFLKMFLFERRNPNQVSYWRVPILEKEKYERLFRWGAKIDETLKKVFPGIFKMLSWNHVLVLRKQSV